MAGYIAVAALASIITAAIAYHTGYSDGLKDK